MTIHIQVSDDIQSPVESEVVLHAAQAALQAAAEATPQGTAFAPEAELTLVLTDDEQLHQLNLEFLGIDAPTDVLSFPADFIDPDSQSPYLGDILISIPRLLSQAEEAGHSALDEIRLLTVHGVLHLLGYDHAEEAEKARMWALQTEILARLGSS